jgi:histone acetyltransferase (RNA polymerase elongator complex component)
MRHYNIPIFIPELACPFQCVFCNQYNITGMPVPPGQSDIIETIESHFATFPDTPHEVEVAFFGGSFTGLKPDKQDYYLTVTQPYITSGKVKGIRISTRPDYIDRTNLERIKKKGVISIELGAQSMFDDVLFSSGRGHTANDTIKASEMILDMGFELGLQMMTGLPGDTDEKAIETARIICGLGAHTTRIYPCIVIKGTDLEKMYKAGTYRPQGQQNAVELCARLFQIFEKSCVKVLRMGLHPSESLLEEGNIIAGPFHVAFGEKVLTEVWKSKISVFTKGDDVKGSHVTIFVHPGQLNAAIGYRASNKKWLQQKYNKVQFIPDPTFKRNQFHVDHY